MTPEEYAKHEDTLAPHEKPFVAASDNPYGVSLMGHDAAIYRAKEAGLPVSPENLERLKATVQDKMAARDDARERSDKIRQNIIDDYTAKIAEHQRALDAGKFPNGMPVTKAARESLLKSIKQMQSVIDTNRLELERGKPAQPAAMSTGPVKAPGFAPTAIGLLRKAAHQFLKTLQGKSFPNEDTGIPLLVDHHAVREPVSGQRRPAELNVLSALPEMIRRATYLGHQPDDQGRPQIKAWHYYKVPVELAGELHEVTLVARELADGRRFYDSYILDKENGPATKSGDASHGTLVTPQAAGPIQTTPVEPAAQGATKPPGLRAAEQSDQINRREQIDARLAQIAREQAAPTSTPEYIKQLTLEATKLKAERAGHQIADHVRDLLGSGGDVTTRDVTTMAARLGLDDRQAGEWAELGATEAALKLAQDPTMTDREKFFALVSLYNRMPTNGARTIETKVNQQYSTPPPLAFAAGVLAGIQDAKVLLEPTAGHGMLTIAANPNATLALNELDEQRRVRLARFAAAWKQPASVVGYDATSDDFHWRIVSMKPDRVAMNPPFGNQLGEGDQTKKFKIYNSSVKQQETTSLDTAIMLNAFDALPKDGKGFAIIGSKTGTPYGEMGTDKARAEGYNRAAQYHADEICPRHPATHPERDAPAGDCWAGELRQARQARHRRRQGCRLHRSAAGQGKRFPE